MSVRGSGEKQKTLPVDRSCAGGDDGFVFEKSTRHHCGIGELPLTYGVCADAEGVKTETGRDPAERCARL